MRYIPYDPKKLTYPKDWNKKAENALSKVTNVADDKKKSKVVNKHSKVWANLKQELSKVMHDKCWYTESPQTGTDTDVDHFRPKNSVKGVINSNTKREHPGYWWLAFDPSNYRYSCIVANRNRRDLNNGKVGGKADEFPLINEENRAWYSSDSCDNERPLLLDPCVAADVALITFAENGEAIIRYSESEKPIAYERAKISIQLYHLNHNNFVRDRIKIRENLEKHIEDAKRYFKKFGTNESNTDIDYGYTRAIEEIRATCKEEAPYSSFAYTILLAHKNEECLEGVMRGLY